MKCAVDECDKRLRSDNKSGFCFKHHSRTESSIAYMQEYRKRNYVVSKREPRRGDVSYRSAHRRIWRERGAASAQACAVCGEQAAHWAYRGGSSREQIGYTDADHERFALWSSDPADYFPLCALDHRQYDTAYARTIEFQGKKFAFMVKELGLTLVDALEKYCA